MANTILTPDEITKVALAILHQKCNFVKSIDDQTDGNFQAGPNVQGLTQRIRKPARYVATDGVTIGSASDSVEEFTTISVNKRKKIALKFTSDDLSLSIMDMKRQFLEPAMASLAGAIEADFFNMTTDVYQIADFDTLPFSLDVTTVAQAILKNSLTPMGSWQARIAPDQEASFIRSVKGLFQDSQSISKQYKEGMMGRTSSFEFWCNTHINPFATGTAAKTTGYLINGANQTGSTIVVDTGTTTFNKGDIITIAGVFRVHPETKVVTQSLQTFVVTANVGPSATSIPISPALLGPASLGFQTVSGSPADNAAITKVGAGASESVQGNLAYHGDAFTRAFVRLWKPSGVDMASVQTYDGFSIKMVRDYTFSDDSLNCRIDCQYGYVSQRPELAVRMHADG